MTYEVIGLIEIESKNVFTGPVLFFSPHPHIFKDGKTHP
jgi:hypothetical protein